MLAFSTVQVGCQSLGALVVAHLFSCAAGARSIGADCSGRTGVGTFAAVVIAGLGIVTASIAGGGGIGWA